MYFIKRIVFDELSNYKYCTIIAHTNKTIAFARSLLEESVKNYVREEKGREATEKSKIIDIHDIAQINEPLADSILLYRLEDDPHKILVYQKKSTIVTSTSWTWSTVETLIPKFYRTDIFELEEYQGLKIGEMIPPIGKSLVQNDNNSATHVHQDLKYAAVKPTANIILDLQNSDKFKEYFKKANQASPLSSAQFKDQI